MTENKMGYVRWWSEERGHGFIKGEDGIDYFVHHTGVLGDGRKQLIRDQEVEFIAIPTIKGLRAVKVKRVHSHAA